MKNRPNFRRKRIYFLPGGRDEKRMYFYIKVRDKEVKNG